MNTASDFDLEATAELIEAIKRLLPIAERARLNFTGDEAAKQYYAIEAVKRALSKVEAE